jgi:hypothetical protein
MNRILLSLLLFISVSGFSHSLSAGPPDEFESLLLSYPDNIKNVTSDYITWNDGSRMLIRGFFSIFDSMRAAQHKVDLTIGTLSRDDIKNDTMEPFLRKMYGNSPEEVTKNLVTIYWMPKVFGKKYPMRVTRVNGVDKKLMRISAALEKLPPEFHKYVDKPASSYYWRNVAKENYLSLHSFGIAVDINVKYSNYWLWDWEKAKRDGTPFRLPKNQIPMEIVEIFAKEGFVWGGRWYHYDTMHFEYRPELFMIGKA